MSLFQVEFQMCILLHVFSKKLKILQLYFFEILEWFG